MILSLSESRFSSRDVRGFWEVMVRMPPVKPVTRVRTLRLWDWGCQPPKYPMCVISVQPTLREVRKVSISGWNQWDRILGGLFGLTSRPTYVTIFGAVIGWITKITSHLSDINILFHFCKKNTKINPICVNAASRCCIILLSPNEKILSSLAKNNSLGFR